MTDKYTLEITKRLDAFKNAKEWPDFISLLTQLDSTIQTYSLPYIPNIELLCKRLNQCLNPLLPAGVHKKVFETYSIIFTIVSREELIRNFAIYTLGLLSFGSYSRILVMGSYLDLLDKYILVLNREVESFTVNILLGILPSMEAESGEYYKKGLDMVNTLLKNVDEKVFYTAIWDLFLQNSHLRLSVILFFNTKEDILCCDKVLIVKALKEGLKSTDLLILRNTLDLILCKFPIKNKVFSDSMNSDLLEGMFQIFSRREQSLNKRIFSWIGISDDQVYKPIITKTLSRILRTRSTTHFFFKIFTTLSDKSYLSEKILEDLLFEVLIYTKDYVEKENIEYPILERKKEFTRQELIDLGKNFFTTDLDRLWKVFYMELKRTFNIKGKDQFDRSITQKEERYIKIENITLNEETIFQDDCKNTDIKDDNIKDEDIKDKYIKNEDIKDEYKNDDITDECKNHECKNEDIKNDNIKENDIKKDDIKDEDIKNDDIKDEYKKDDDIKNEYIKNEYIKYDDINTGNITLQKDDDITLQKDTILNTENITLLKDTILNEEDTVLCDTTIDVYNEEQNKSKEQIKIKKKKSKKVKKVQSESKILKTPSEVLSYINFCISNYNVYDNTVFKTHLPILISFVLENYNLLDEEVKLEFLSKNISKILLKDQSDTICNDFFDLIDDFYTNENAKILKNIQSSYLKLISKYLLLHLDERNYILSIEFYQSNKEAFNLEYFVRRYYEWMIKRNLSVIENSLCLSFNNGDLLFKELWSRFIKGNVVKEGTYGAVWNINNSTMINNTTTNIINNSTTNIINTTMINTTMTNNTNINNTTMNNNSMTTDHRNINANEEYSLSDKMKIAFLIFEYNKLFKRKYEKLLVKKVNELNKQNICLFLYYLLEMRNNESYHFYNIFFLLNCKISGRDPVLTSLIKSVNSFRGIFSYTLGKFLNSNIESLDFVYSDKPNISQIKGVLKLIKNILFYSRRFKFEISSEFLDYDVEKFTKILGEHVSTYKNIIINICVYLYLTEFDNITSNDESIRNFKIQSLKMIQFLLDNQILLKNDILSVDFTKIIDSCKKYRNDPALIIPIGNLISLYDNTNILIEYSSILDSNCFYYFDLLEVIFKLEVKHISVILPLILDNLGTNGYSFMIYNEVIKKMIQINSNNFNWASITKSMIQKFLTYSEISHIDMYNLQVAETSEISHIDMYNLQVAETSEILFNTFSGYFIEYLINSNFSEKYILSLPFRNRLYAEILSSYMINQDKTFKFLLSFDSICTTSQRLDFYNNSINTLYQITNYRTFTDVHTLHYLLNVYSILPDESSQYLSVIYQSLSHMQRYNIHRSDKLLILNFLSNIEYTPKIRSALQTFIGYIFDLLKTTDKVMKSLLIEELIKISTNTSINIKSYLIEYLGSRDFFFFKLRKKAFLYRKIFEVELNVMDDLVYKLESSFFASQVSDINNKCNVLKRISFLIFANDYNKFGGFNSKFIEMSVTLIKHNSIKVRKKAWFLIKILSLKIDHNKLLPLFPVVFSEILTFLNKGYPPDNPEYSSIVRLLDLLFLLNSSATFEFKSTCLNIETEGSLPLFVTIYRKLSSDNTMSSKSPRKSQVSGLRKLFFTQKIIKSEDVVYFFKHASAFYNVQDRRTSVVDTDLLENTILNEFHD